jgi:hypothetical protein
MIDAASLGPDALKAAGQAFDAGWSVIAGQFHNATGIEAARLALADAISSLATDSSRDVGVLENAALQVRAQNYTSLPIAKAKVDKVMDQGRDTE